MVGGLHPVADEGHYLLPFKDLHFSNLFRRSKRGQKCWSNKPPEWTKVWSFRYFDSLGIPGGHINSGVKRILVI